MLVSSPMIYDSLKSLLATLEHSAAVTYYYAPFVGSDICMEADTL